MSLSITAFAPSDVPESFENSKLWLALEKAPWRETSPASRRVTSMGNIARFGAPEWARAVELRGPIFPSPGP